MKTKTTLLAVALTLASTAAMAQQQQTVFDDQGRVAGRVLTDSSGKASVVYDRSGKVTGRTATDSSGVTTIYGPDGSKIGTVTGAKK